MYVVQNIYMNNVSVIFASEARKKLEEGIDLVGKAVATTLGPRGRNVVIFSDYGPSIVTKDGVTVAKSITSVEDPYVNLGVQLCKEVSMKTNSIVGDGTTTSTVLAQAIVKEGIKLVAADSNPLSLKRGMDKALDVILNLIDESSKKIEDRSEIEFVATISGNDPEVGKVVAEAIETVGSEGIITLEESRERETYFKMVDGFSFTQGFISPYFATDTSKNIVDYNDVNILMFNGPLLHHDLIVKILEKILKSRKPVLFIAESYSQDLIQLLAINKYRGQMPIFAVKTPGFGQQKSDYIQDICAMVGGKVFNEALGDEYDKIDESYFGFAKRIVSSKDNTTIIEGRTNEEELENRIQLVRNMLETEQSDYAREKLNERLANLNGGVALIKIGASTELELKEKKYRYEDALNATRAAIECGIVPGGGTCLLRISETLEQKVEVDPKDPDELLGVRILAKAIRTPFMKICENGGFSPEVYASKVLEASYPVGFDAKYGEICDLFERGVIDPSKVVKSSLTNAVSIATLVFTTETLIAPVVDKNEKILISEPMY